MHHEGLSCKWCLVVDSGKGIGGKSNKFPEKLAQSVDRIRSVFPIPPPPPDALPPPQIGKTVVYGMALVFWLVWPVAGKFRWDLGSEQQLHALVQSWKESFRNGDQLGFVCYKVETSHQFGQPHTIETTPDDLSWGRILNRYRTALALEDAEFMDKWLKYHEWYADMYFGTVDTDGRIASLIAGGHRGSESPLAGSVMSSCGLRLI